MYFIGGRDVDTLSCLGPTGFNYDTFIPGVENNVLIKRILCVSYFNNILIDRNISKLHYGVCVLSLVHEISG